MDRIETQLLGRAVGLLETSFLGNSVRDYLISLVILAATLLAAILAHRIIRRRLSAWAQTRPSVINELLVARILNPGLYILIVLGIAAAKSRLDWTPVVSQWLDRILLIAGLSFFFLMLIRFVQGLIDMTARAYTQKLEARTTPDTAPQVQTVERIKKQIKEITTMLLVILAVLTVLSNLGVNLKAIWASLGIGGIAVVVAVKEPLTNIIGRMYIYGTGLFDEGHFIIFGEWSGTVKRISMFRTYMELFADMSTVSIPNANFISGVVKTNFGRTKFMYKWDLDVPYDVSSDQIQELARSIEKLLHDRPEVNRDMCWVYLDRLDRYSKVLRVWFQARQPDWSASLFYGNHVLHDIQGIFAAHGVDFAFPTQTLHLQTSDPFTGEKQTLPVHLPDTSAGDPPGK